MKRLYALILSVTLAVGLIAPIGVLTASAQTATTTTSTSTSTSVPLTDDASNHIDDCLHGLITINIAACFAEATYYIPFSVGDWLMGIAARAFDVAASFTLSSKLYTSGSFLQQGWQITRDFSNIFFILMLLFIALSLALNIEIGHANPKKMLVTLVVVALIINFSFFITEVVIDISNSLALVFYNQVSVVAANKTPVTDQQFNQQLQKAQGHNASGQTVQYIQTEKPLSVALVKAMEPQVLSSNSFYNQLCSVNSSGFFTTQGTTTGTQKCKTSQPLLILMVIFILVGIMYLTVAYCFIIALFSLFGRMVTLFISIVFAPIAFISLVVPKMRGMSGLGYDDWFSTLMSSAFAAPLFFFFILLISLLSQTSIIPTDPSGLSPGILLLLVAIQFMILITLMLKATAYVQKASGEIGDRLGNFARSAISTTGKAAVAVTALGVGTAIGAGAALGEETLGSASSRLASSEKFTDWAANGKGLKGLVGKKMIQLGDYGANASYDPRKALSGLTGVKIDSFGGLSQQARAGGFRANTAREAQKELAFANKLKENQSQSNALKDVLKNRKGLISEKEDLVDKKKEDIKDFEATIKASEEAIKSSEKIMADAERDLKTTLGNRFSTEDQIEFGKSQVTAAQRNLEAVKLREQPAKEKGKAMQGELRMAEKDLKMLQGGKRDGNGKQIKVTLDEVKADGTKATQKDVDSGKVVSKDSLSVKDLESLIEGNKKANTQAYLHNKAESSGARVDPTRDKMGKVETFTVGASQSKSVMRSLGQLVSSSFKGSSTVGGNAGPGGRQNEGFLNALRTVLNEEDTHSSYRAQEVARQTVPSGNAANHYNSVQQGRSMGAGIIAGIRHDLQHDLVGAVSKLITPSGNVVVKKTASAATVDHGK